MKMFIFAITFLYSAFSYGADKIQLLVTEEITNGKKPPIILLNDLYDTNGALLVAKNTPVSYSLEYQKRDYIGKPAALKTVFGYVEDVNGAAVFFKGNLQQQGKSNFDLSIGLTFGLMPILGPFSPFFLLIKGENTSVAKGTVLEAEIDANCENFFSDMADRQMLVKAVAEG